MWVTVRGTGLLLSVLVLGHLLFVHLLSDVSATNASFVARRWAQSLWLAWDGAMLSAAFIHGAAGALVVVRDYVRRPRSRRYWQVAVLGTCALFTALGWFTIAAAVFGYRVVGA